MLRTMRMCRSTGSRRESVPSGQIRMLPSVASIASPDQSGCPRRRYPRSSSAGRPSMSGGRSACSQSSHDVNSALRSSQPPSTRASAAAASGCLAASTTATSPPHACPTTIAPGTPSAARSSAAVPVSYPSGGASLSPCERGSTACTGCPAAESSRATSSHSRALPDSPGTNRKGRFRVGAPPAAASLPGQRRT